MQVSTPVSPESPKPQLSDSDFFGVKPLPKSIPEKQRQGMPDWYDAWLSPEKLKQDFVVWHDAWPAVEFFIGLDTQWREGFNGRTGLDYSAALSVIALYHKNTHRQIDLFESIKALEKGVLHAIFELREAAEEKADAERKAKEKN